MTATPMRPLLNILNDFRAGAVTQAQLLSKVQLLLTSRRADVDAVIVAVQAEQVRAPLPAAAFEALLRHLRLSKDQTLIRSVRKVGGAAIADSMYESSTVLLDLGVAEPVTEPVAREAAIGRTAPIAIGTMLGGRFRLVNLVGEGGMSRVYKAIDLRKVEAGADDPHVALKVLTLPFADYTDAMAMLHRETRNLQELTHPNIVRVIDCDRDGETVFMTMEYLPGKTLHEILHTPDFSGAERGEALPIIRDIAGALQFAHDKNLVHGDLKPGNVMVTEDGAAKVIDFGIARLIAPPIRALVRRKSGRRDAVSGLTPAYASPEMLEEMDPDPRDDIYALACMAWEVMTGAHPFDRKEATAARDARMKPKRSDKLKNREYRALVRALQFERGQRTPSARRFIEEFTGVSASRMLRTVAAGVLAVIAIAAAIATKMMSVEDAPQPVAVVASATQTAQTLPLSAGSVFRDCPTCPLMTVLPPGQFTQGSAGGEPGTLAAELPRHDVTIAHSYAASQHEVTVGEFAEFAKATGYAAGVCATYDGSWSVRASVTWKNAVAGQTALHPVSCVSWEDANAYARWLSDRTTQKYRLPSAAEWEYAARGGAADELPWQAAADACANANVADRTAAQRYPGWTAYDCVDAHVQSAPVGSFAANPFGLHDLFGNVFEWTQDCWSESYQGAPSDGSARHEGDCSKHETRGGSWFTAPANIRAAYRNRFESGHRSNTVGFRVLREIR